MSLPGRLFGLTGFPLEHSRSPEIWSRLFEIHGMAECSYRLFPLANINDLPALITSEPCLAGLNVTIPYKHSVIPFLDHLDEVASATGAVNTIRIDRSGSKPILTGFNTDTDGFIATLPPLPPGTRALVLGTGGASAAVTFVLKKMGIPFVFVSRKKRGHGIVSYQELDSGTIKNHLLVINTTPTGMFPDTSALPPLPYEYLTRDHILIDLVYNPPVTRFLERGSASGTLTINGLRMLEAQAESAFRLTVLRG